MVYVSSIGPIDGESQRLVRGGIKEHTRQCLKNLKAILEANGTSMDKVVWANWSLRDAADFDVFNEEWARWFPSDPPTRYGVKLGVDVPGLLVSIRMTAYTD